MAFQVYIEISAFQKLNDDFFMIELIFVSDEDVFLWTVFIVGKLCSAYKSERIIFLQTFANINRRRITKRLAKVGLDGNMPGIGSLLFFGYRLDSF